LDAFYRNYYELHIEGILEGLWHRNTIEFCVHDKHWDLSLENKYKLDDPCNATNTAAQLMKLSKYRHSSVNGYKVSHTSGGALWINPFCPGIQFLVIVNSRSAVVQGQLNGSDLII
jgi:hypothetical protein